MELNRKKIKIILLAIVTIAAVAGGIYYYKNYKKRYNVGLSSEQVKQMKQLAIENIQKEFEEKKKAAQLGIMMKKMSCSDEQKNAVIQDIEKKKAEGNLSQEEIDKLNAEGDKKIEQAQKECAKKYEEEMQKTLAALEKEEQSKISQIEKNPVNTVYENSTPPPELTHEQKIERQGIDPSTGEAKNPDPNSDTVNIDQEQINKVKEMQDYINKNPEKLKQIQDQAKIPLPQPPANIKSLPGQTGGQIPPY